MIEKDDWRLNGQEKYLQCKTLYFRKWVAPQKDWDHDHCAFCWEKFSNYPDTLHEGYATHDRYHWICPECFHDFKTIFQWEVIDESEQTPPTD